MALPEIRGGEASGGAKRAGEGGGVGIAAAMGDLLYRRVGAIDELCRCKLDAGVSDGVANGPPIGREDAVKAGP